MFSLPDLTDIYILKGTYSIPLVVLSILIACWASYTALSINQRIQQNSFFHQSFWLLIASTAMGLGIWAMHFIGMSALLLPVPVKYDVFLTVVSIIPAMIASYIAFYFANKQQVSHLTYAIAGMTMGIGISSMHYIGMAAMIMDASHSYRPWIFTASVIIAVVVSYIALFSFSALQKYMGNWMVKVIISSVMGLAVAFMHYTGMFAVVMYTEEPVSHIPDHMMDTSLLITVITVGIAFLLLITGLTSMLDRYVDYRLFHFDPLTLFPNQRLFEKKLYQNATSGRLAVLHLHNLEKWNSRLGYTFGDKLIQAVSEIIQKNVPNTWSIYRIEGHRFAIFQPGRSDYDTWRKVSEKILSILKKPIQIEEQQISIDAVCVTAYRTEKGGDIQEQYAHCMDVLKYPALEYKHELITYDPSVHLYSFENQIIESIHQAMDYNELFIEYQPKVCTRTRNVSGLEALIRWKHPEYGIISPGVFIPILENNGEIFKLTDWIIEAVCKQIADWVNNGVPFRQVSINIPGTYLTSPKLEQVIRHHLVKYDISSKYIELEITETSVIDDIDHAIEAVHHFRRLGLSVALDDFGTGLSSLSNLKRIPINTVKIDKSFVDDIPLSEKDAAVLTSIINLCTSLNLKIVIEGVETREQMHVILSLKEFPHVQGYFFSRPLAPDDIVAWIWRGVTEKLIQEGLT